VRQHADFDVCQLGIGLDPIDERRTPRRHREQTLERDHLGLPSADRFEGFQYFGVGELEDFAGGVGDAFLESGQAIGLSHENAARFGHASV
jgi:hypothetical protein